MPKRIPILAAKDIAETYVCRQVVICAWDGKKTYVVTYGPTPEDNDQAAQGGAFVMAALGWTKEMVDHAYPSRLKRLNSEIEALAKALDECRNRLGRDAN